jgi:hypothetical protein
MNVNNFTEFYNLIKNCGLSSTSPFDNFIRTTDQYLSLCECTQPTEKSEKLSSAKSLYEGIVSGPISSHINSIKIKKSSPKIHFYSNGRLLRSY